MSDQLEGVLGRPGVTSSGPAAPTTLRAPDGALTDLLAHVAQVLDAHEVEQERARRWLAE